jgi:peptidoglycan/LPS O-acetylase OafA/YrhL
MAPDPGRARSLLPEPRPISPAFSTWLDALRWVAAMAVCITHVRSVMLTDYTFKPVPSLIAKLFFWMHGFGHQAVIVFFVLSGYLVGGEVLRGLHRADFSWRSYSIRRLSRVYPVYLAALLLGALWDNLGAHYFDGLQLYDSGSHPFPMIFYCIKERLTPTVFTGNLVFLQTILVPTFGSNSPLWSLANEAWYYALFPLLLSPFFSAGRPVGRLFCLILFTAGAWFLRDEILAYFSLWLIGAGLHFLPRPLISVAWLSPLLLGIYLATDRLHWLDHWSVFQRDLVTAGLLGLWVNQLSYTSIGAPGPAAWHKRLAGFSYSLYLVHWPLGLFLAVVLNRITGQGYRMAFSAGAVLLYGSTLAFIYAFAWLVAQCTERQTGRIRNKLLAVTQRAPVVAAPAA